MRCRHLNLSQVLPGFHHLPFLSISFILVSCSQQRIGVHTISMISIMFAGNRRKMPISLQKLLNMNIISIHLTRKSFIKLKIVKQDPAFTFMKKLSISGTIKRFCSENGTWEPIVSPDIQCRNCSEISQFTKVCFH